MQATKERRFDTKEYLEGGKKTDAGKVDVVDNIPLDIIRPNPFQPRKKFNKAKLEELTNSIKEKGVLQPITVREVRDLESEFRFEIAFGERRFLASKNAGLTHIRSIIKELSDQEMKEIALIENIQREDLAFVEEMNAYAELRDMGENAESIAQKSGKNKRTVEMYLKINSEISSIEEINSLINSQADNIDFTTANVLSKMMPDIRKLKKSNTREFNRVLKNMKEAGIKEKLPWLAKKFLNEPSVRESANKEMFRETDKDISIHIRLLKNKDISNDVEEEITKNINTFLSRMRDIAAAKNMSGK